MTDNIRELFVPGRRLGKTERARASIEAKLNAGIPVAIMRDDKVCVVRRHSRDGRTFDTFTTLSDKIDGIDLTTVHYDEASDFDASALDKAVAKLREARDRDVEAIARSPWLGGRNLAETEDDGA